MDFFSRPSGTRRSGVQTDLARIEKPTGRITWREVTGCYIALSKEILKRGSSCWCVPGCPEVAAYFTAGERANLLLHEVPSNDSWTRDHGGVGLLDGGRPPADRLWL